MSRTKTVVSALCSFTNAESRFIDVHVTSNDPYADIIPPGRAPNNNTSNGKRSTLPQPTYATFQNGTTTQDVRIKASFKEVIML